MQPSATHQLQRSLTIRYVLALGLIAMLACCAFMLEEFSISSHQTDASVINISGRQRMLSQRMTMFAEQMASDPNGQRYEEARRNLKSALHDFKTAHHDLIHGNPSRGIPFVQSDAIRRVYFDDSIGLDAHANRFISIMEQIAGMPIERRADVYALLLQVRPAAEHSLLDALDTAVQQYEQDNINYAGTLLHYERIILAITLLTILLEGIFIFRPAVQNVEKYQKKLRALNRIKSEFLANMSHEIRTPLNGIFGMAELLQDSKLNEQQHHYVQTMLSSADNLLTIIDDLLDFSRLDSGKVELEPIPFNLRSNMEDVAELLASSARAKQLDLMVNIGADTPEYVVGDPGRIRQIVCNLTSNAIKFTDHGYVMIHVERVADQKGKPGSCTLKFSVEDTGIGIAKDKQQHIFDKFSQADNSSTRQYGGTGLGLTICKRLVHMMQGKIGVESEPGKGSTFWFTLDMACGQGKCLEQLNTSILQGVHALVVDDIELNQTLLLEHLRNAGMRCDAVSSGEAALSALRRSAETGDPYELAIVDYLMPHMDGEILCRTVKNDKLIRNTSLMILTSAGERGYAQIFARAGAAAFMNKPFRADKLIKTITLLYESRKKGGAGEIITMHSVESIETRVFRETEKPLAGKRILLVEDNRVNRELTSSLLSQMGCSVICAENGKEAIASLHGTSYDLILMDCQMPVMDGFEASEKISSMKAHKEIEDIPVVALTANAMVGDRERCLKAGMNDYLSKPVRRDNLERMLVRWIKMDGTRQSKMQAEADNADRPAAQRQTMPAADAEPSNVVLLDMRTITSDPNIDQNALEETRNVMGEAFVTLVEYFLEDTTTYIHQIREGLQTGNTGMIVPPSHTIKSSSRQFGLLKVSELSRQIEELARSGRTDALLTIAPLCEELQQEFDHARSMLKIVKQKAG
ncbi:MAG: response regulator [Alphaproteobacteria bacterium]